MIDKKPIIQFFKLALLLVFPSLLLFFTLKLDNSSSSFSQRSYDPEYLYLISGLTLGSGKLNVGHIDNPGTPIQIIIAISTRIQHLLDGESDYITDACSKPGQYIQTASYVFLSIIVLLLAISGFLIYKKTKQLVIALFIQTAPFLYKHIMVDFTRLTPDSLMIIPVLIFTIYSIYYIQKQGRITQKEIIGFSIISGLGLAFKLNFISFWIIPIVLFKGWKNKIIYLLSSIAAFLVFGFPVLFNLNFLWKWIISLFMHSGSYGMGEANIVEWPVFFKNLSILFKNYWFLYITIILSIINLIVLSRKKKTNTHNYICRMLLGAVICVLFHTFLVSKHFAYRYMYNVLYSTPLILFLNFELLTKEFSLKKSGLLYLAGISFSIYFINGYNNHLNNMVVWKKDVAEKKLNEHRIIKEIVKDEPFVIIPIKYNLMFEERGVIFGCAFAGGHKEMFQEKLVKMKPDLYLSEPTSNKFWHWMEQTSPEELQKRYNEFYLFVGKDKMDKKDLFLNAIGCEYHLEEIRRFKTSGNLLFLVKLFN